MNFTNKVVLVTGGSRGIGKQIALSFARVGAKVAFVYNSIDSEAQETEKKLNNFGHNNSLKIKADLGEKDSLQSIVDAVVSTYGTIDILVNNAGISYCRDFDKITYEESMQILKVNTLAPLFLSQIVGRIMLKNKSGKIVNIASTSGYTDTCPDMADYNISKAGVVSLTKDLARAFAPYVNVNAVAPSWVNTEMMKQSISKMPNDYIKTEKEKYFLKRFAEPSEIADAVLYLASENSSYINGQIILLDGGHWQ